MNTIAKPPIKKSINAADPPRFRRGRSFVLAAGRIFCGTILALLVLELVFNVAGLGGDTRLQPDPVLGFANIPNHEIVHRLEGFSRTRLNSFGMRNREVSLDKPSNVVRIAVLGDSSTEALQVADEETFCRKLEEKLNKAGGKVRFEVLNFGVSSYSAAQEFVMFKERALKFHPDIAIFMVRLDAIAFLGPPDAKKLCLLTSRPLCNLVGENQLAWTSALMEQWQYTAEAKRMRATSWLRKNSRLWTVLGTLSYNLQTQADQLKSSLKEFSSIGAKIGDKRGTANGGANKTGEPAKISDKQFDTALIFLTKMLAALTYQASELANSANCRLIVFVQPTANGAAASREEQILRICHERNKVPYEDLRVKMVEAAGPRMQKLFYSANHPKPAGHELYAELMLNELSRHKLLPQ